MELIDRWVLGFAGLSPTYAGSNAGNGFEQLALVTQIRIVIDVLVDLAHQLGIPGAHLLKHHT